MWQLGQGWDCAQACRQLALAVQQTTEFLSSEFCHDSHLLEYWTEVLQNQYGILLNILLHLVLKAWCLDVYTATHPSKNWIVGSSNLCLSHPATPNQVIAKWDSCLLQKARWLTGEKEGDIILSCVPLHGCRSVKRDLRWGSGCFPACDFDILILIPLAGGTLWAGRSAFAFALDHDQYLVIIETYN